VKAKSESEKATARVVPCLLFYVNVKDYFVKSEKKVEGSGVAV
jgi:hypothetical protein